MAVVYMLKLEQEPENYDSKFTSLTKGTNLKVQDWILERLKPTDLVAEAGCGTGAFAVKIAKKGCDIVAIDKNFRMINIALKNFPRDSDLKILYQVGSSTELPMEESSKDVIVSTFMISELRPFEQQMFLRSAWKALKENGRLLVADEFTPSGIAKVSFKLRRWRYKKKLRTHKLKNLRQINWFYNYIEPISFKITNETGWNGNSIRVLELQKVSEGNKKEPAYYRPKPKPFQGLKSQLRIYRCLLTGQIDRIPIEPGIYRSGNPNEKSPILVSANYDYTYIKLMRSIKKIDAWVLLVDSNGINVWCAARGDDFGNKQLIEAVEATGIQGLTEKRTLILPQFAAGGVSIPEMSHESKSFPFKISYGPVWAKNIPKYLEEKLARKPENMKIAKFTLDHRLCAGITHTTFLFRKIFVYPILALLIFYLIMNWFDQLFWVAEFCLWIIVTNIIVSILFPLSNFTRRFILKGIFFGLINMLILGTITWYIHASILTALFNALFYFWLAFFCTMSFSGYTMSTNPREIQVEYIIFRKLNMILLVLSIILVFIGQVVYLI